MTGPASAAFDPDAKSCPRFSAASPTGSGRGAWSAERGKVIGSAPDGLTVPNRTSAIASPPRVPGYQASITALDAGPSTASAPGRRSPARPRCWDWPRRPRRSARPVRAAAQVWHRAPRSATGREHDRDVGLARARPRPRDRSPRRSSNRAPCRSARGSRERRRGVDRGTANAPRTAVAVADLDARPRRRPASPGTSRRRQHADVGMAADHRDALRRAAPAAGCPVVLQQHDALPPARAARPRRWRRRSICARAAAGRARSRSGPQDAPRHLGEPRVGHPPGSTAALSGAPK